MRLETAGCGQPSSRYNLDTMPTLDYRATADETFRTNITFFQSPLLADGPHTLLITNQPCQNLPASCKLMLDYIVLTVSSSSLTASASASSTWTSASATASSVEATPVKDSGPSIGVIVGPVAGVVLLFILIGLFFWIYVRKVRQLRGVTVVDIMEDRSSTHCSRNRGLTSALMIS